MSTIEVDIIYLDDRLKIDPKMQLQYAKVGDAGMDVRACIDEPVEIWRGRTDLIPLGFRIHIANPNYCAVLIPRSGQGHKEGIILGNSIGLIDSGYQGQVYASVLNRNPLKDITIEPMQKIAQLVFLPIPLVTFNKVESFEAVSERSEGGFGHTGK